MRRNLYNLVTHHGERKFGDVFHRSMFSVMLLRCLKRHGYFGPDRTDVTPDADSLSDDELFIGHLLNHFLEVLQFNSHEVRQRERAGARFRRKNLSFERSFEKSFDINSKF